MQTSKKKDSEVLSIGFDRVRKRRQCEMTNNKNITGKHHVRYMLKDAFGFAEHQEKGTYSLSYRLTLTRSSDNSVLNKANETKIAEIKINSFQWYVPHYTPSLSQQDILSEQKLEKVPEELQYVEGIVSVKEKDTQNFWTFELRTLEGINLSTIFGIDD